MIKDNLIILFLTKVTNFILINFLKYCKRKYITKIRKIAKLNLY